MQIIPEFASDTLCETYHGLILSLQDALLVLEATRRSILPNVKRRLNDEERKHIRAGSVYVWNERECGMKRWTDGKNWLATEVKGPFLTYKEHDEYRKVRTNGLTKQIFSLTTKQNDKMHLIAYYDPQERANRGAVGKVPSRDPLLASLQLDPAVYLNDVLNCNDIRLRLYHAVSYQALPVHYQMENQNRPPHHYQPLPEYYCHPQFVPYPYLQNGQAVLQQPFRPQVCLQPVTAPPHVYSYSPAYRPAVAPSSLPPGHFTPSGHFSPPASYSGSPSSCNLACKNSLDSNPAFTYDDRRAHSQLSLPSPSDLPATPCSAAPDPIRDNSFSANSRFPVKMLLPIVSGKLQYHQDDRNNLNALDKAFSV